MARCMIFASELPFHFRVDAVEYAAYSLTVPLQMQIKKVRSPMKVLTDQFPSLGEIVDFGSPFTVYRYSQKKNITPRGQKEIFIGLVKRPKGIVFTCQRIKWLFSRSMCKMSRH